MQEFWYYEQVFEDTRPWYKRLFRINASYRDFTKVRIHLEKILLVKQDDGLLTHKFNLTKMGLEHINSFSELQELCPPVHYDYKSGKPIK